MLVDTNVFVDFLRGNAAAGSWFAQARASELRMPVYVAMELYRGASGKAETRSVDALVKRFRRDCLPRECHPQATRLMRRHGVGGGPEVVDVLIATLALHLQVPVATHNVKDFRPFEEDGLNIVQPW